MWKIKGSLFLGLGGSVSIGSTNGQPFFIVDVGVGLGGGISFDPSGNFPQPSNGSALCGSQGYIGFAGNVGLGLGPASLYAAGQTGGIVGNNPSGQLSFPFTQSGSAGVSFKRWGVSLGGGGGLSLGYLFNGNGGQNCGCNI